MNFYIDDFVILGSELALLLFDWGMVVVDLEPMYFYFRVNSGHIFVRPSKAILVLLEELAECKAEFGAEVCSNLDLMVRVVGMDADIVKLVYARLIRLRMLNQGRL